MLFAGNGVKVEMDQNLCHGAHSMWLRFLNSRIAGKMRCFARGQVSFWPVADMTEDGSDVRFWGESGHTSGPAERRQMTQSGHHVASPQFPMC